MLRSSFLLLAALTLLPSASLAADPSFLAADVQSSPTRLHPQLHGHFNGDRAFLRDATMTDLITAAYEVERSDILGGPAWLDFDRFDINAKAPAGTKFSGDDDDAAGMAMVRSLLADRFGLILKVDNRPLPAFVLTVDKADKMKRPADATAEQNCGMQQTGPASAQESGPPSRPVRLTCTNVSMDTLADVLHNVGGAYFNRPVIDQTRLNGSFDINIEWTRDGTVRGDGAALVAALDKQMGLKIESKLVPTPVVLIRAVNEKPTPNIPGLDKILPPPPPARFDVAVIHEANPAEKNYTLDIEGNRVTVKFATLQTLIYKSFDTPPVDIEGKPKWLDTQHYDIVGTVTSDRPAPLKTDEDLIDEEDEKEMIRSLLADRFQLVTHIGSRPAAVFALIADNPKMTKANANEHPGCAEGPGPDGKDPRISNPLRNRLISCQNMTMAQFALELHQLAAGFVPAPVIDSTGLTGSYDFSISFSRAGVLNRPSAATQAGSASNSEATDPGSGGMPPISLFDALRSQLGLKLEKRDNVTSPTLVIDHVDENPTDN